MAEHVEKKTRNKTPDWRRYGDPRNVEGRFVPKRNLKSLMGKGRKWTRASLAEAIGLKDLTLISKWISGKRYMSDADVVRCAMATRCSVPWLLDLTDNPGSTDWPEGYATARQAILHEIRGFSGGKTWGALASDYHRAVAFARQWEADLEAEVLKATGCSSMSELERMKEDEVEGALYYDLESAAIDRMCSYPPPWDVEIDVDYYGNLVDRPICADDISRTLNRMALAYPGDYRDPGHLAQAMLEGSLGRDVPMALDRLAALVLQAAMV